MDKIKILIDEGSLVKCPSAYVEVYVKKPRGGIPARNGWHEYPKMCFDKYPDWDRLFFAETVEKLMKRIDNLYPEDEYIREYV